MRCLTAILMLGLALPPLAAQKAAAKNLFSDLQRATQAIETGELDRAARLLGALVADAPDFSGAWFQLALCRRLQGANADAAQAVERVLALDPANTEAAVLAVEIFATVDRARAVSLAGNAAEATEDPRLLRRVLDVLVGLREVEAALPILDRVIAAHPKDLGLLEVKARWALEAKKPAVAAEAYQAMLQIKPQNPPVLESLARVQIHLGRRAEARKTMERTLRVNPSNLAVREQLIKLLEEDGADAETLALHRRYLGYYRFWARKRAEQAGKSARPGK